MLGVCWNAFLKIENTTFGVEIRNPSVRHCTTICTTADCVDRRNTKVSGRFRRRSGAPERIRTSDLCLRRAALYPAELRVRRAVHAAIGAGYTRLTVQSQAICQAICQVHCQGHCRAVCRDHEHPCCDTVWPGVAQAMPPVIARNTSSRSGSTVVTSPISSPAAAMMVMISAAPVFAGS